MTACTAFAVGNLVLGIVVGIVGIVALLMLIPLLRASMTEQVSHPYHSTTPVNTPLRLRQPAP